MGEIIIILSNIKMCKAIRGREGRCCFGCSVFLGFHLIVLFCLVELAFCIYLFNYGKRNDMRDWTKIFWFVIESVRIAVYLWCCIDRIHKRKTFFYTMLLTTIAEAI